jgi:hypothetical protein
MKKADAVPRTIITDRLRSYGAARREVMPCVEHRQSKYLNDEALPLSGRDPAVSVRGQQYLAPLPAPPTPDDRTRLPR